MRRTCMAARLLAQLVMMKEWNLFDSTPLAASARPDPSRSAAAGVESLSIGTWVFVGILIIYALLWIYHWRHSLQLGRRPWWIWLGWGLALIVSVFACLWSVYFLGSGSLGWAVPSLAAIAIPLYVLWYQQTNQKDALLNSEKTINATDSKGERKRDVTLKPIINKSPSEGRRQTVADPNRPDLTLADLRQVINFVSQKLREKDQIDSIVSISNIGYVRYPIGRADARQLWAAVFEAALDEPPATLMLLLDNIRDSLGTRSRSTLENTLRELGLS